MQNQEQKVPERVSIKTEDAEKLLQFIGKLPLENALPYWNMVRSAEAVPEPEAKEEKKK